MQMCSWAVIVHPPSCIVCTLLPFSRGSEGTDVFRLDSGVIIARERPNTTPKGSKKAASARVRADGGGKSCCSGAMVKLSDGAELQIAAMALRILQEDLRWKRKVSGEDGKNT